MTSGKREAGSGKRAVGRRRLVVACLRRVFEDPTSRRSVADSAQSVASRNLARRGDARPASRVPRPAASRKTTVSSSEPASRRVSGSTPDSAYPMLIQRKIDSAGLAFDVVNAGVSGETSSGLLDRLDWLQRGTFDVLVLETGANDGLRGIPPATLKANLESALDRLKAKRPDARVLAGADGSAAEPGPEVRVGFSRRCIRLSPRRRG